MKKLLTLATLYFVLMIASCIPDKYISAYVRTVTGIDAKLTIYCDTCYSYTNDANGKQYLNVIITPKSYTQKIEATLRSKLNNTIYADEPSLPKIKYTNHIDSLAIFTLYDYDETHPANSLVNNILNYTKFYERGETPIGNLEYIEFTESYYYYGEGNIKLKVTSSATSSDSVQFRITGRLSDGILFDTTTELLVFQTY